MFAYPTTLFQKTLCCFPRVNWHFLHTFMDYFQGCYKNGTNNTQDYRYIAGMYLLIRIIHHIPDMLSNTFYCRIFFNKSLILGFFVHYHTDAYNRLDCVYFGLYTCFCTAVAYMCSIYYKCANQYNLHDDLCIYISHNFCPFSLYIIYIVNLFS